MKKEKKLKKKWFCKDCKKEMYVLKYKKLKDFLNFPCKKGVCYYCKSENLKYIGEIKK